MRATLIVFLLVSLCDHALITNRIHAQDVSKGETLWAELASKPKWVFLGDSNTYAGGYVAIMDAWLKTSNIEPRPRLFNLGVSSETASGLSEVDHPFKRPCVHERLDKTLRMTNPDVVFVCYGMNDGIYQSPSAENLAAYRQGMLKLASEIKTIGARLVVITPPIFEPEPVAAKGKLGPSDEGRFAYFAPAANYDLSLEQQSQWCLTNEMQADVVIDVHTLLNREKRTRLKENSNFCFSGDGVHFGEEAHGLVAEHILRTLGAPATVMNAYPENTVIAEAAKRQRILRDANLSRLGKNRPGLPAGWPLWYAQQLVNQPSPPK